jgi:hypothetical protein
LMSVLRLDSRGKVNALSNMQIQKQTKRVFSSSSPVSNNRHLNRQVK